MACRYEPLAMRSAPAWAFNWDLVSGDSASVWATALTTQQTRVIPSRFTTGATSTPQFELLYLSENHLVALFEVEALLGSATYPGGIIPHPRQAWTVLNVDIQLRAIADLISLEKFCTLDDFSLLNKRLREVSANEGDMRHSARCPRKGKNSIVTSHVAISTNIVLSTCQQPRYMRMLVSTMVLTPPSRTKFLRCYRKATSCY